MNFLSKIFGGSKNEVEVSLEETLQTVINKSGLSLSFDIKVSPNGEEILFDLFGEDEEIVKNKEGAFLDATQLFLRRVAQNKFKEQKVNVIVDCNSFREDADNALIELADKLKDICLKKKKPVYFRAFPPRERKLIHQYLADDTSVKSKSVGEGLYKKIKVFPADLKPRKRTNKNRSTQQENQQQPS